MVMTTGAFGQDYWERYDRIISQVESHKGNCLIVQLIADKEVLLKRVVNETRIHHKKISTKKRWIENFLQHPGLFEKYPKKDHPTFDTSKQPPQEVAEAIIAYYRLNVPREER